MEETSSLLPDLTNRLSVYSWKAVEDMFSRYGTWLAMESSLLIGIAGPGGMHGMSLVIASSSGCNANGQPFYLSKTKGGATGIISSREHPENLYFIDEKQRPGTIAEEGLWISALSDRGAIFNRIAGLIGQRDSELDSYCQSLLAVSACIQIHFIPFPWPRTEAHNPKRMKAVSKNEVEKGQLLLGGF